jgi:hypothetical protein
MLPTIRVTPVLGRNFTAAEDLKFVEREIDIPLVRDNDQRMLQPLERRLPPPPQY